MIYGEGSPGIVMGIVSKYTLEFACQDISDLCRLQLDMDINIKYSCQRTYILIEVSFFKRMGNTAYWSFGHQFKFPIEKNITHANLANKAFRRIKFKHMLGEICLS